MPNRLVAMAAALILTLVLGAAISPRAMAQSMPSITSLRLPFPAGTAWKAIQGYNGGTHVPGPEQYALDLVRDGGPTGGTPVVAPAAGSVWFAHAPGAGNGCILIKIDNGGGLIVEMCHVILSRTMSRDERVSEGARLGTIGADGRVGNNGTAHLHLSMHRTGDYGQTRVPVPFSLSAGGLMLEGRNLAPDGSHNQFGCASTGCVSRMVSTNGTGVVAMAPATVSGPTTSATSTSGSASTGSTRASASRPSPSPSGAPAAPAGPLRVGAAAVVSGAGDCVNVREQPSTSGTVKDCLTDGTRVSVVEGPVVADGYQWWRLEGLGWAVSNYLTTVAPSLEVGGRARVNAGAGDCLNVRIAPGRSAQTTGCIANGTLVRLVQGPFDADGTSWWQLEGGGWVAGEYLAAES